MRDNGGKYRTGWRSFAVILGALLGVGVVASSAWASPPSAPSQPGVSAGIGQITVTFSAPTSDGGKPINAYIATCYPIHSNTGIAAKATNSGVVAPIVVAGLTNGAAYVCIVQAANADGISFESDPSEVVVVGAPATLAQPVATAGHAQITVAFSPPGDNGSPINSYTALCTSNTGTAGSNTGAVSPIVITVLTNGADYTCTVTATNAFGTSAQSPPSNLVVPFISVPVAPPTPTVGRGDTTLTVFFSPPADNGGLPITSYSATCLGTGAAGTNIGTASPIVVTGLTNNASYTCTVSATNALGTSPPSPPSAVAVPAPVPDAPAQPTVTAQTGAITVTFIAPSDNGTPISSYSATCMSSNGGVPAAQSGPTSPITVSGVTDARTYTCTVAATSATGTGPSSPPSVSVIPTTVPAPPTLRAAGPGNGAAVVAFTPVNSPGAVIVNFIAVCVSNDGGATGIGLGPGSAITVPGLSNGKIYTCNVRATNAIGVSDPSATSRPFIVGTPGKPTITHVVSGIVFGSTAPLNVTFNPGPINGSAISAYTATCTPLGTGVTGVSTNLASPVSVGGLLNGHAYSCVVVATNARGISQASAPVAAIVGTPAVPTITHVLLIRNGVVLPFAVPPSNGSPVIYYQGHCTSSNGGVQSTQVELVSPIVANHLTGGLTYTCTVAAVNLRGAGAPNTVGPFVIPTVNREPLAACHDAGTAGTLFSTPGLQLSVAQRHTYTLSATLGTCAGPYVQKAKLSASFQSSTISCSTAIGSPSGGSGTLTWINPGGLGTTAVSLAFTFVSTAAHVTLAQFHGVVTSASNLFSGAHVGGTLTLNRGLGASSSGGDCPASGAIDTFAITTIAMNVS
ncbi:MAG: fibronectin type III domain-containing protein [Acidimicrobiia bacterium]